MGNKPEKNPQGSSEKGQSKDRFEVTDDYRSLRIEKLNQLKDKDINPFPDRYERTHLLDQAKKLEDGEKDIHLAGRLISVRVMGKLCFSHLMDYTGKMQIALEKNTIGEEQYTFFKKYFDIGDFIGCTGEIFTTKKGEKTLMVHSFKMLSKSLRPLPEKWHGLTDKEQVYRHRYLDLIMNPESRDKFKIRTRIIKTIRNFLEGRGFDEVETPVLQTKPSGALATPFITHHNSLDIDVYLRIAPETYLKRCIVGGYDKVFEFARSFRNEGMDPSHLQDFTMLEYYCAYWNYIDNMDFTVELIKHTLQQVMGTLQIEYKGNQIDFSGKWPRKSLSQLINEAIQLDINQYSTAETLADALKKKSIKIEDMDKIGRGKLIDLIYKKFCRPHLIQPVFLISHPLDLSPLARKNDDNPLITDRFQLVVNGWEVVNAYSELVDPIDQRKRLEDQARLRTAGDEEAMVMDEDYLTAMEYGMPPISGWGMGIDRFVALLTNSENLRDIVLFPLMRPL